MSRGSAGRQPPDGPPICTALNFLPPLDAAADVEDDVAQRRAHRHLDEAAVDDLAGEAEDLGALARVVAVGGVAGRPRAMIQRHVGQRLDVVDDGRLAAEAADRGERRPRARHAALALDRGDQRGLLAADERAGALLDLEVEVQAAAEDVVAEQAALLRRLDRHAQALDGERVLGAHVDVAVVGADGVAADDHALEHGVRVAVHHRRVHERAGVALVAVADDVLRLARRRRGELPFHAGGEPGASAAAQAASRGSSPRSSPATSSSAPCAPPLAAPRQVLVEALGVDDADVTERDAVLRLVERDDVGAGDVLAGAGSTYSSFSTTFPPARCSSTTVLTFLAA